MAGRIRDEDVALVRERARIEDVVGATVMLRKSGGGSLKGLCPFHEEKTPSFQVTPSRGLFYCFGCGEGGDVITFLEKLENLSFTEVVEHLADKYGVQLRYTDERGPRVEPGLRQQIIEANKQAAEFFAEQLARPDGLTARQFLDSRGFNRAAAEHFGVGYAPRGGRELARLLRSRGFSDEVLIRAGLIRSGGWDFFQGRVLWPIRDAGSSVLGFGARRLFDDDRMPAKYLNTPETPVYRKSHVLYGLDLARQNIGKRHQAVVVEGYTDVMAAHLAGVTTAVASCGTAFGDDHARLLQRLMGGDAFAGEVIFTFDGDAAGQAAALKVFGGDHHFIAQTYVAVEPSGLDPCDLRLERGDEGVRDLVARRIPLYKFVMQNVLDRHDLDRVDGRLAALREAAPLVASIRDRSMVDGYARELSQLLGMDLDEVRREVHGAAGRGRRPEPAERPAEPVTEAPRSGVPWPDPGERELSVERGTAHLLVTRPDLFGPEWSGLTEQDFRHPAYREIFRAVSRAEPTPAGPEWVQALRSVVDDPTVVRLLASLGVETPLREPDAAYVTAHVASLQVLTVTRQIDDLKSKLMRTNPVEYQTEYNQMFSTLLGLENRRQELVQRSVVTSTDLI
ncbi:DNA primase [Enemella sp. A6]|uniref:DNA primase n=1 Tax=Enemella sp. A6 TaxID=3440152 RepID=UPI003EBD3C50